MSNTPAAIKADSVPIRTAPSLYPKEFADRVSGRVKRELSKAFGLTNITINLTTMAPGSASAIRHSHKTNDEFVYVLKGNPLLRTDDGGTRMSPGMCAGFKAGTGNAHHLINDTDEEVLYIEAGDNSAGDEVIYPDDDLKAELINGKWVFLHKDGRPY
jgi:uncharacterized cupin superfamily protein